MNTSFLTRRNFLRTAAGAAAIVTAGGLVQPARAGDVPPTESNIEGPYYRKGAPYRNQLYDDGEPGRWLLVWGHVLAPDYTPLAGSLVDVWQADDAGAYDNNSPDFRGRGWHLTDDDSLWWVWTVWPGYYPGRPYHLHLKANQKGYRALTTQLYFRDDPRNANDPWYRPSLELDWAEWDQGVYGAYFDIVLARA